MDGLSLEQQILVNNLVFHTGCRPDTSLRLLHLANWQYEVALSMFLSDSDTSLGNIPPPQSCHDCNRLKAPPPSYSGYNKFCVPSNTPVTPPNFPEALAALAKLSTSSDRGPPTTASTTSGGSSSGAHAAAAASNSRSTSGSASPFTSSSPPKHQPLWGGHQLNNNSATISSNNDFSTAASTGPGPSATAATTSAAAAGMMFMFT